MKRFICLTLGLLLFHSDYCNNDIKFYCAITLQNGQCYEEYFNAPYLELIVRDFASDSNIESVFITRDL